MPNSSTPVVPEDVGPTVTDTSVTFRVHDRDGRYEAVGLLQELQRPRDWLPLTRTEPRRWEITLPRAPVDRMEYQFKGVLVGATGDEVFCDPANPLRVPGAFGDKSVVEFPGYEPPAWLADEPAAGEMFSATLTSRVLRADVAVRIWASAGLDPEQPAPLLVAHDGKEYEQLAGLLTFLGSLTDAHAVPPLRAALIDPPWPRDEHYSASATFARALVTELLPAIDWLAPVDAGGRIGMGASLGALAMLHSHWLRPQAFAGLYLQSGSYFRQRYDSHESGFPRFRRVTRFVGEVLAAQEHPGLIPITITCGEAEENLANNTAVAAALERQGFDVAMVVHRDAHNYVAWRDTFDPHLGRLLGRVWATSGPSVA